MKSTNANKYIPKGASQESHRHAWNFLAKAYTGGTALPAWGTRGELQDQKILADVTDAEVLEIGFGSGDSIIYLLQQGARHVTGVDFSLEQFKIATKRIQTAFKNQPLKLKKVELLVQSMDDGLPPRQFDHIISVYSIGWSERPSHLFQTIYNRLKPGGYFYFSWDHYLSRIAVESEGKVQIVKSYHEPMPLVREDWKGSGVVIETHQLRPSDWFQMLREVGFVVDGFWEPKPHRATTLPEIYSENYAPRISEFVPTCVVFRAKKV